MIEVSKEFDKSYIENVIRFYKLNDMNVIVKRGLCSVCHPLYCKEGKGSLVYSDGSILSTGIECEGQDRIVGFLIKLKEEGDIFHELEHAKRYTKSKNQNELVVELISLFRKFVYSVKKPNL